MKKNILSLLCSASLKLRAKLLKLILLSQLTRFLILFGQHYILGDRHFRPIKLSFKFVFIAGFLLEKFSRNKTSIQLYQQIKTWIHSDRQTQSTTTSTQQTADIKMLSAMPTVGHDLNRNQTSRRQLGGDLPPPGSTFDTLAPPSQGKDFQSTGEEHLGRIPVQYVSLQSGWAPRCISRYSAHDFWHNYQSAGSLYLFHGCSLGPNSNAQAVITSLEEYGPHLRFSRTSGFLFRRKAVYWSNSFEYAVMWCYFRSKGYWPQDWNHVENFSCVVYVSKLCRDEFNKLGKIEVMKPPQDEEGERQFEKVSR